MERGSPATHGADGVLAAVSAKCSQDTANRNNAVFLKLGLLRKDKRSDCSTHYKMAL